VSATKPPAVAVVDDDDAVRGSIAFLLEVAGHTVATFASAAAFLAADVHHLACLILDHHMPQMTGLDLAAKLRADGISIPILLITGSLSSDIIAHAAALGIERVLEKPPGEDDLLEFINTAMS
jgi:FixJ family two-component response regulator